MPLPLIVLVFIGVPLAELYVIYVIGDAIGVLPTLLLLAADSALGALLLRSQGRSVWRRFTETMAAGQIPHKELQHGVAVVFGAAFLITPGFLTDIVGLLLLVPPTRGVVISLITRAIARRVSKRVAVADARAPAYADVEGTASQHGDSRGADSGAPGPDRSDPAARRLER